MTLGDQQTAGWPPAEKPAFLVKEAQGPSLLTGEWWVSEWIRDKNLQLGTTEKTHSEGRPRAPESLYSVVS